MAKTSFTPYSDNIIFFDTEFSSNDPKTGEILSLAFVKPNGEELYLELEYSGQVSEWVKENVLPTLNQQKVSREEARVKILDFAGGGKPFLITFVNQFDYVYLCKIISYDDLPFDTTPIDFAAILFSLGVNPHEFRADKRAKFLEKLGISDLGSFHHYALDDAKILQKVYIKLLDNKQ